MAFCRRFNLKQPNQLRRREKEEHVSSPERGLASIEGPIYYNPSHTVDGSNLEPLRFPIYLPSSGMLDRVVTNFLLLQQPEPVEGSPNCRDPRV